MDWDQPAELPMALLWRMVKFVDEVAGVSQPSPALRLQAQDLSKSLRALSTIEIPNDDAD